MVDWLKPKPKYDPLDDRAAFDQARRRPQQRFNPPENSRDFPPERDRTEESRFPPEMRRSHYDERPQLSERYQEKREEYREQYAPKQQSNEYQDEYVPYSRKKRSKIPLVLTSVSIALVIVGVVIAVINLVYVRNPGQTVQSLTMIHGESVVILLTVLINILLTKRLGDEL